MKLQWYNTPSDSFLRIEPLVFAQSILNYTYELFY